MYFIMRCDTPQDDAGGYASVEDGVRIDGVKSWRIGERITVPVPRPINLELVPEGGYRGPPAEMFHGRLLLMSERLVEALREAGVDNMDTYPAVLRNVETGETHSYHAVNIIGLVSAANLAESEATVHDDQPLLDVSFESLALDEGAAAGALLFRLAENNNTIVIQERVRDHIRARGIDTLKFIEPKDWVHL